MDKKNYNSGVKFKCQGSGKCCISRGSYGFVYLSEKDLAKLSKFFNLSKFKFIEKYCSYTNGFIHLKEIKKNKECLFLKKNRCTVYKARPTQCRTWPFWPENMKSKKWNKEIANFCPGIGKGTELSDEYIEKKIKEDLNNEKQIYSENLKFNYQSK
tara:strand:+ start:668 stop:1135 length:468 start_codon:yes stop_codon:yes gene_type:complete